MCQKGVWRVRVYFPCLRFPPRGLLVVLRWCSSMHKTVKLRTIVLANHITDDWCWDVEDCEMTDYSPTAVRSPSSFMMSWTSLSAASTLLVAFATLDLACPTLFLAWNIKHISCIFKVGYVAANPCKLGNQKSEPWTC